MQDMRQTLLLLILTNEVLCCRETTVPNSAGCSGRELQAACAGLANHNRPVAATAHLHVPQLHTCLGQVSLSTHLCRLCFRHFTQALAMAAPWEEQHLAVCFKAFQLCHSLSVSASKQEAVCPGYADDVTLCHVFVLHSLACQFGKASIARYFPVQQALYTQNIASDGRNCYHSSLQQAACMMTAVDLMQLSYLWQTSILE